MPNSKQTVWITGVGGLIGSHLLQAASRYAPGWQVYGSTRAQVDLTDLMAVQEAFHQIRPQALVHCAALTSSGVCEQQPGLARRLNLEVTTRLAELASNIRFIFFSTDLVFDGRQGHYDETDQVNPLSVYGETKAEAERLVLANPNHTVIRTSLNGGTSPAGNRGFNEDIRCAWEAGRTLKLFTDEFRCPIPAAVTAHATWELIVKGKPGLYHLAGTERLSRWQIGQILAQRWARLNPKMEPASRLDYAGPPRSADTSLNCAKLQQILSFPLPGLTGWLAAHPDEVF